MILLKALDFTLPLSNPVIIFSLVLFIILFAPILFNKIKVPHIIGLILAGVIVGPYGLNLLRRDSSIVLFGTVGLLYIMFLAGLEIDRTQFSKNKGKILVFGLSTFLLPLVIGTLASFYILKFSFLSSILLASMFSTHTLISYPIASRYGIVKNRAVTLTIGGTMITDILALLILASVTGMTKEEATSSFWWGLGIYSLLFVAIVFFIFPPIIRWFFKRFEDSVSQYIFVLAIVFLSAFLAEAVGLEAIIGAFFSGLVLNQFVPHSSALMNRIEFVGNALFIPFFLISVGMLVDVTVLVKGWGAIKVAGVIVIVALITKYLAALITQKVFGLLPEERSLIFGLSASHAAATLAIILVGYNIILGQTETGEPIRLLNEDVLNGTILLILISCGVSSFVVERASRKLALHEEPVPDTNQKMLISLASPENLNELVDFGMMLKSKKSNTPVYALHIVSDENDDGKEEAIGKKMISQAVKRASATENSITPLTRHDINISNGIIYTIKEHNITDVLLGLHRNANAKDFLGSTTEKILRRTYETIYIYQGLQPFNTLKRMIIVAPPKAELEPGFAHWMQKLILASKEAGLNIVFYGSAETIKEAQEYLSHAGVTNAELNRFTNWKDFATLAVELRPNDLFVVVASRKGHVSYTPQLDKLSYYLTNYFTETSFLLIYPKQLEYGVKMEDIEHADGTLIETITDNVSRVGKVAAYIRRIFSGRKNDS